MMADVLARRGAASRLYAQGKMALAGLALIAVPVSGLAQEVAPAGEPGSGQRAQTEAGFTPLQEIDRVRETGCGLDQFPEFLRWYSLPTEKNGWLEQVVFTYYMVRIADLAEPAGERQWIERSDYLGQFRIASRDVRASERAPNSAANADYRTITTTPQGERMVRVDWAGGPGYAGVPKDEQFKQAGAYIFEHLGDCWYLTADLR